MGGVGAAHPAEVAMGFDDCDGIWEIKGEDEFCPCHGVEQASAQKCRAYIMCREVFMEQQEVVAEVEIGFPWVGSR